MLREKRTKKEQKNSLNSLQESDPGVDEDETEIMAGEEPDPFEWRVTQDVVLIHTDHILTMD